MTAPALITAALILTTTVLLWLRARRRQKRQSDYLLSWTEWDKPRHFEIDVRARPLKEKSE